MDPEHNLRKIHRHIFKNCPYCIKRQTQKLHTPSSFAPPFMNVEDKDYHKNNLN